MTNMALKFVSGVGPELYESFFSHSPGIQLRCIRGRNAGAYTQCGTFAWTSAVQAICAVTLRTKLSIVYAGISPCLEGGRGSLAASLDYAIAKQPLWLGEMFGTTIQGGLFARRLFLVSNSQRRRPGPVAIAMNPRIIPPSALEIFLDGYSVTETSVLKAMLSKFEASIGGLEQVGLGIEARTKCAA